VGPSPIYQSSFPDRILPVVSFIYLALGHVDLFRALCPSHCHLRPFELFCAVLFLFFYVGRGFPLAAVRPILNRPAPQRTSSVRTGGIVILMNPFSLDALPLWRDLVLAKHSHLRVGPFREFSFFLFESASGSPNTNWIRSFDCPAFARMDLYFP